MIATQIKAQKTARAELIELEARAANGQYITVAALCDAREEAALEAFEAFTSINAPMPAHAELIELEARARNGEYITVAALSVAREEAAFEAFAVACEVSTRVDSHAAPAPPIACFSGAAPVQFQPLENTGFCRSVLSSSAAADFAGRDL